GRERHRRDPVEPHLDAAVGERLDHDGDVGGPGARESGDGVQQVLPEHDHTPDRAEDLAGDVEVAGLEALRLGDGRDALEDERAVRREQALDERLAHVPGADEPDRLALDRHRSPGSFPGRGGRGPKTAVPTRTIVAPSSIATSKSPLMPIESSASPCRSPSLRSVRNHGRAPSASGASGGIAMSPRTRTWPSAAT